MMGINRDIHIHVNIKVLVVNGFAKEAKNVYTQLNITSMEIIYNLENRN